MTARRRDGTSLLSGAALAVLKQCAAAGEAGLTSAELRAVQLEFDPSRTFAACQNMPHNLAAGGYLIRVEGGRRGQNTCSRWIRSTKPVPNAEAEAPVDSSIGRVRTVFEWRHSMPLGSRT